MPFQALHSTAHASRRFLTSVPQVRRLQDAGFLLVFVTNQSGVERGYCSLNDAYVTPHHPASDVPHVCSGVRLIAKEGRVYCCQPRQT